MSNTIKGKKDGEDNYILSRQIAIYNQYIYQRDWIATKHSEKYNTPHPIDQRWTFH